jgi:hypothetical protein
MAFMYWTFTVISYNFCEMHCRVCNKTLEIVILFLKMCWNSVTINSIDTYLIKKHILAPLADH